MENEPIKEKPKRIIAKDPVEEFEKTFHQFIEEITDDQKEFFLDFKKKQASFSKEINQLLKEVLAKLSFYEERMKQMTKTNIAIEETLTNVLLAITQNQFLQAWYPEQKGIPEMKVVGRHPKQASRQA